MDAEPRSRAQRRRDTGHRLTHDIDVWVASASADGEPYLDHRPRSRRGPRRRAHRLWGHARRARRRLAADPFPHRWAPRGLRRQL